MILLPGEPCARKLVEHKQRIGFPVARDRLVEGQRRIRDGFRMQQHSTAGLELQNQAENMTSEVPSLPGSTASKMMPIWEACLKPRLDRVGVLNLGSVNGFGWVALGAGYASLRHR
jgi:hypothetical protein